MFFSRAGKLEQIRKLKAAYESFTAVGWIESRSGLPP